MHDISPWENPEPSICCYLTEVQRENNGLWMTSAPLSGSRQKREESHFGPESVSSVCLSICLSFSQSVRLSVRRGAPMGVWVSRLLSSCSQQPWGSVLHCVSKQPPEASHSFMLNWTHVGRTMLVQRLNWTTPLLLCERVKLCKPRCRR